MPQYGCINARRNQLHEVIRLSGMNQIIDDTDHPLIIKVASIQAARMQVYFIDNEDYFQRKHVLTDADGKHFEDNDERAIFFARGVLETVKKLRWSPDIVHCHGWFTGLVPLYLKKSFSDDPLFANSKIVFTAYDNKFEEPMDARFAEKVLFEGVEANDVETLKEPNYFKLNKLAIDLADAVAIGSPTIDPEVEEYMRASGKPVLDYHGEEDYIDAYNNFYDKILE
jgi:starch synthase